MCLWLWHGLVGIDGHAFMKANEQLINGCDHAIVAVAAANVAVAILRGL